MSKNAMSNSNVRANSKRPIVPDRIQPVNASRCDEINDELIATKHRKRDNESVSGKMGSDNACDQL